MTRILAPWVCLSSGQGGPAILARAQSKLFRVENWRKLK